MAKYNQNGSQILLVIKILVKNKLMLTKAKHKWINEFDINEKKKHFYRICYWEIAQW